MSGGYYGQGSGLVLLSGLLCNGSEARLVHCESASTLGCDHDNDVGIKCGGNFIQLDKE